MTLRVAEQRFVYPYVYWDGAFTESELQKLINYCDQTLSLQEGSVIKSADGGAVNKNVRNSKVKMFHPDSNNSWIFDKLYQAVDQINNDFYRFDLTGFNHFQYSEYNGKGTKYDFHIDTCLGTEAPFELQVTPRKLSIVMMLSEPEKDFKGGEFEIMTGGEPIRCEQKKGRILAFPSWILHRVAPVTKGNRKSIVVWVLGPKFK
jgi:PKHD-type hydroxylase